MIQLPTVTVGIPAYQSEANIARLLRSLTTQRETGFRIEAILVFSDGSTDNTVQQARSVKDNRIRVFASTNNKGYAQTLSFLIKKSKSDIFVTFNDDILIPADDTISALIEPFLEDENMTFVGGHIQALPPNTFVGRCIYASYLVFLQIRMKWREGHNRFSCDGKALALRKDFSRNVSFQGATTATVDIFLYFENLRLNGVYRHAPRATVQFRLPETIQDWNNLHIRTQRANKLMKKTYGSVFEQESAIPTWLYLSSVIRVFLRYPLHALAFKLMTSMIPIPKGDLDFKKWELTASTKKLNLI